MRANTRGHGGRGSDWGRGLSSGPSVWKREPREGEGARESDPRECQTRAAAVFLKAAVRPCDLWGTFRCDGFRSEF